MGSMVSDSVIEDDQGHKLHNSICRSFGVPLAQ